MPQTLKKQEWRHNHHHHDNHHQASIIKTEACYETSSSLHIRDKICSTEKQEWRKWHQHELLNENVLESYFCLF